MTKDGDIMYGKTIRERREELNMTQEELAVAIGNEPSNKSAVSAWENELNRPTHRTAKKLANVLGGKPIDYRLKSES